MLLASLTATAVRRGWPPAVYARLVAQIRDTLDAEGGDAFGELFASLAADPTAGPLHYEYVVALSADVQSALFFPNLVQRFAHEQWQERAPKARELMAYLARAAPDCWQLPPDFATNDASISELSSALQLLVSQAVQGSSESRLLVCALARTNVLSIINAEDTSWRTIAAPQVQILLAQSPATAITVSTTSETASGGDEIQELPSSRSLRFLWLDWLLRTAQPMDWASLRKQLDLMWPDDRVPVVSYELCVTAFDVVAAPSAAPGAPPAPALAATFVTKKLPLILQQLAPNASGDSNGGNGSSNNNEEDGQAKNSLDSVVARLFTTMDKDVVEAVEQRRPGLRADFGRACIDLGLCDPTVLHALHLTHTPQPQPELPISPKDFDIVKLLLYNPENQAQIAREVVASARGTQYAIGRHRLAQLCEKLLKNLRVADELFVHASVRDFLESVCVNADAASQLAEDEGFSGLVYADLGALLTAARMLTSRYSVSIPNSAPWTAKYIANQTFPHASQLSPAKQQLMGQWVVALFSKSSGGIGDELLRPFNELSDVISALLQQAIRAYRSAVIDRETLKNGIDHFVTPQMVTLLAPLALRVLYADLFESTHKSTTLECILFFLTALVHQKSPEADLAKALTVPLVQKMLAEVTCELENKTLGNTSSINRLLQAITPLVTELAQQHQQLQSIGNQQLNSLQVAQQLKQEECEASPHLVSGGAPTSSLAESVKLSTTALMVWQQKPQGVPMVPTVIVSARAKPSLGARQTRALVEKTCTVQSRDTTLAILVADGLWSPNMRLADVAGDQQLSDVAKEFLAAFNTIFTRRDLESRPPVLVVAFENNATTTSTPSTINAGVAITATPTVSTPVRNIASMNTNIPDASMDIPMPSFEDFGTDFTTDALMDDVENKDLGFDNDYTSQPMNLADLDSAMDFGWE